MINCQWLVWKKRRVNFRHYAIAYANVAIQCDELVTFYPVSFKLQKMGTFSINAQSFPQVLCISREWIALPIHLISSVG